MLPHLLTRHQSVSSEKKNSSKTKLCWLLRVSADGSGAGGPNVHLFCYLVHVTNVGSLIWIRIYAHADQLPELKDRKTSEQKWISLFLTGSGCGAPPDESRELIVQLLRLVLHASVAPHLCGRITVNLYTHLKTQDARVRLSDPGVS